MLRRAFTISSSFSRCSVTSAARAAAVGSFSPKCINSIQFHQQQQPLIFSQARFCSSSSSTGGEQNEEEEFSFDASAAISQDARQVSQQERIESLVTDLLASNRICPNPPQEAAIKLRELLTREPINDCIQLDRVVITHVQNEEGEDSKLKLPEMSFAEAMEQAKENGRDLVQMAANRGVAYCRLRDAKTRAVAQIEPILTAAAAAAAVSEGGHAAAAAAGAGAGGKKTKEREMNTHTFRDVADAHFCQWRGRKVVGEMSRGHPIKLQMLQFVSPEAAARKMQEMLEAVRQHATTDEDFENGLKKEKRPDVGHHSTGIHMSEKELAVTLKPTEAGGTVKHPSAADWRAAVKRHEQICKKSDRKSLGTYAESKHMKRKTVGQTSHRVDKFGRKK